MKLQLVVSEDWEGLYVDGILKHQGHTIRRCDIFDVLGITPEVIEPDEEWLWERGSLPERLVDVKVAE